MASDYRIAFWIKESTFAVLNERDGQFELQLYLYEWI